LEQTRRDWFEQALIREEFQRYFEETKLQTNCLFNYDILDIFYWEHRCGTWVNEVVAQTDFAFNTLSLLNCRHIFKLLLSAPFHDRVNAQAFNNIISRKLPEIDHVAINPA